MNGSALDDELKGSCDIGGAVTEDEGPRYYISTSLSNLAKAMMEDSIEVVCAEYEVPSSEPTLITWS